MKTEKTLKRVDPRALIDGPNVRSGHPAQGIEELARSIAELGVIEPLVARPSEDGGGAYVLVAGHRRKRAAIEAGLETVPVMLVHVDDSTAGAMTTAENLVREELTVVEEAEAISGLAEDRGVEEIAHLIGRSPTHVRGRLLLAALPKKAKTAISKGDLLVGSALILARVSQHDRKEVLDAVIKAPHPVSPANVSRMLGEVLRELDRAPFDVDREDLHSTRGACSSCEHRTKAEGFLFAELEAAPGDRCLLAECYAEKVETHFRAEGVDKLSTRDVNAGNILRGEDAAAYFGPTGVLAKKFVAYDFVPEGQPNGGSKALRTLLHRGASELDRFVLQAPDGSPVLAFNKRQAEKKLAELFPWAKPKPKPKKEAKPPRKSDETKKKARVDEKVVDLLANELASKKALPEGETTVLVLAFILDAVIETGRTDSVIGGVLRHHEEAINDLKLEPEEDPADIVSELFYSMGLKGRKALIEELMSRWSARFRAEVATAHDIEIGELVELAQADAEVDSK